jgi:hypothetical protein
VCAAKTAKSKTSARRVFFIEKIFFSKVERRARLPPKNGRNGLLGTCLTFF